MALLLIKVNTLSLNFYTTVCVALYMHMYKQINFLNFKRFTVDE